MFSRTPDEVLGADDLGEFRASVTDVPTLLSRCRQRYAAVAQLTSLAAELATKGSGRDLFRASQNGDQVVARLTAL